MLDYGDPKSIDILQAHAHELAAVLVEPVQSRRPDLQPKEFLQQLRQLTAAAGIALIFDEVLVGFRIHPGGAQAWFGIEADIVTYGKIIGGGTPIGVVAGKAIYMDGIDGGLWNYGDTSYPQAEKTFFAGTFNKNHMGMAVARAVLKHLKNQGPALQQQLNQRTLQLATTLNTYFELEDVPIRIVHFGSLFRFAFSGNLDLLFYHLLSKGVYIWEGRTCFLSTAHTDEDIDYVIQAIKDSVEELQKGGFFAKHSTKILEAKNGSAITSPDLMPASVLLETQSPTTDIPLSISLATQHATNEAANETQIVLLTEAQKQLWVLTKIGDDGSVAYNVSLSLQLQGSFRLAAMCQAVQEVVDRHEAIRTVIDNQGDFQQIMPSLKLDVPLIDFSDADDYERESRVAEWFKKESQEPLDLIQGPLFRIHILKLEEQLHLLVLTAHHIVIDGWSMSVILQEIGALYSATCQGVICQLQPPMQFREYIKWQEQQSQTEKMAAHESYWLEKFDKSIPVLDLPTDRPRPSIKTYKGSRQSIRLDANLCRKIKRLNREQGCTLFMTLLAVYTVLLHRITTQDDMVVGIPAAGRSFEGSDRLVGYCAHILPIRSYVDGEVKFSEYLESLKSLLLEAYEHQDYPFARLLNQLRAGWDFSRSPLVTVTFNLERPVAVKMFEIETEWFSQPISSVDYDLNLNATEINGEIVLDCDYSTDLFEAATIERLLGHFQTLLKAIVSNPQQPVSELPLLTASEGNQLLVEWNNTQKEYSQDKCIHQLIEEQVKRTPESVAVVYENQQFTYQELNCRANQLANYLQALGVKPEVPVGICVERSLEMLVGLLGILKAGGADVPLDPDYPKERLAYMLSDSQVSVLLTQNKLVNQLPEHKARVVCLDTDWAVISQQSDGNPVSVVTALNLAYVIYTSGSTGMPKGVMIEHRGMLNHLYAKVWDLKLTETDAIAQTAPQSFDISVWQLLVALLVGGRVHIFNNEVVRNPAKLLEQIEQQGISILEVVPSLLQMMLQEIDLHNQERPHLSKLRWLILTGEALPPKLCDRWLNYYPTIPMLNAYGPTECSDDVTHYPIYQPLGAETLNTPIGRAVANTQLYILNPQLQPVPIGVAGELYVGGVGVGRGYLNNPELTAQAFIPNPFEPPGSRLYKTGDKARYLSDGNIEFLGRIDYQVKIRGFRIELLEIEALLAQHPRVRESVVIVWEQAQDKRLVGYVVPHQQEETPDLADQLRRFLKEKLPEYMMPSAFVMLESLPLTPNGKVDRRALPAPEKTSFTRKASFVPPRDSLELQLTLIWEEVLNVHPIGVQDNFFELGGHSLLALHLMAQIQQQLGKNLPLATLLQNPTIEQIASTISQHTDSQSWSPLVAIQPEGSKPPFFCVPGGGMDVIEFYHLARYLNSDQPFYGLQPKGLDGELEPHTRIAEMATCYIEAIQTIQPQGPYFLGGHSFGGYVVFEMAQLLQKQGHEVALLAILDEMAIIPNLNKPVNVDGDDAKDLLYLIRLMERFFEKKVDFSDDTLLTLDVEEQLNYLAERLKVANLVPPQVGTKQLRGFLKVSKATGEAFDFYVPENVYSSKITFFRASEVNSEEIFSRPEYSEILQDPALGWNEFSAKPVEVHIVPGDHVTMMTEPHVLTLAERLQICIDKAQVNAGVK